MAEPCSRPCARALLRADEAVLAFPPALLLRTHGVCSQESSGGVFLRSFVLFIGDVAVPDGPRALFPGAVSSPQAGRP